MFDKDYTFYLISLCILVTFWWIIYGYYREKLRGNHFWEVKG